MANALPTRAAGMVHPEPLRLICDFEGYHKLLPDGRAAPYLCPARVATIGYGSIYRADGSRVTLQDLPITREEAADLLAIEIAQKCLPAVRRLITAPLPPIAEGVLVSFAYNLGAGALQRSNLRRVINAREWHRTPQEFAKWRMAGGVVLRGLVRRRRAEADMFLAAVLAADAANDDAALETDVAAIATGSTWRIAWSTITRRAA
jgi:lysozyme